MIFFDIDRTLFDYDHAVDRAMEDFYERFQQELDLDLSAFRRRWIELYEQYWPAYELGTLSLKDQRILRMQGLFEARRISTVQAEKYARFHNDAYVSHWRLFPDVIPLLDHLQGKKLGVISNGNDERQRAKLTRTGIADRFEVIVISAAHGCAKPDPRIFLAACQMGGALNTESIHIGDNLLADIAGAAGAGLSAVWIDRLGQGSSGHPGPTITSLTELIGRFG